MIRWLRRAFANWLRPMDPPDLGLTEADLSDDGWTPFLAPSLDRGPLVDAWAEAEAELADAARAEYAYISGAFGSDEAADRGLCALIPFALYANCALENEGRAFTLVGPAETISEARRVLDAMGERVEVMG